MQTFAESTMNELLGWYGYDKVELRDSEANDMRNYRERRQQVSVLKGKGTGVETGELPLSSSHRFPRRHSTLDTLSANISRFIKSNASYVSWRICNKHRWRALFQVQRRIGQILNCFNYKCLSENSSPKPRSLESKINPSVLAMKPGEREPPSVPSSSPSSFSSAIPSLTIPKEHKSAPVIVPLIKPSAGSVESSFDILFTCERSNCPVLQIQKSDEPDIFLFFRDHPESYDVINQLLMGYNIISITLCEFVWTDIFKWIQGYKCSW